MHREEHDQPVQLGTTAAGRTAKEDLRGAALFGVQALGVASLLALAILLIEQVILAHPARLGPSVSGFPWERIVELERTSGEIVFFGDSVVQTAALGDTDARLLPDMLAAEIDAPVLRVSQAATSCDMHAAWLRYAARLTPPPRAVIVPVNLRAFSPHWERNPAWVFSDTAAMIDHPLYARMLSVLEWDWGRPTDEGFAASPVFVAGVEVGTVAALDAPTAGYLPTDEVRRGRYLVRYASDVERSRRLSAFEELVTAANGSRFPVILYLTPIDVEQTRAQVDAASYANVEANLERLRTVLRGSRWPTADLSEAVRAADFDHPLGDPHEHLKWRGRIVVAEALARALSEAGLLEAGLLEAGRVEIERIDGGPAAGEAPPEVDGARDGGTRAAALVPDAGTD
jgi:hypothetical protein